MPQFTTVSIKSAWTDAYNKFGQLVTDDDVIIMCEARHSARAQIMLESCNTDIKASLTESGDVWSVFQT